MRDFGDLRDCGRRFRKIRNESRYEARGITEKEAEQIIETAEKIMPVITEEVRKKL